MKKRNVILVSLVSILVLGTMGLGMIGCTTGSNTPSPLQTLQTQVAALQTWQTEAIVALQARPTSEWVNSSIASAVSNVSVPNLSNYVTLAQYNDLLAKYTALEVRVAELEGGGVTPTTPAGKVTVEITDAWGCDYEGTSLEGIYSSITPATYRFTVTVTNNTDDAKWIYCSLILTRDAALGTPPNTVGITATKLSNLTYGTGLTYITSASPSDVNATMLTFVPTGTYTRFSVGKGKTVEVDFLLAIQMDAGSALWSGDLMYSAKDTP